MNLLIQSISKAKKHFLSPQKMNFEQLSQFVESFCAHFKLNSSILSDSENLGMPTGVIAGIIPEGGARNHIAEFLPRALLSGNTIILHANETSNWPKDVLDFISQFSVKNSFYQEDLIQIVNTQNQDEFEILVSHPAINAVYGAGSSDLYLNLMKNSGFQTKKHFWRGSSSNSFLVLADANLDEAFECFWKSVSYENGKHPTSTKKLLLLESHLPEFKNWLSTKKLSEQVQNSDLEKLLIQIKAEEGKILMQGTPTVVLDLPHCSELQQIELNLPVAFVSTVKYSYEMAKWNNTGQYAMSAIIFGSKEKAEAMAKKLDVGFVWINRAFDPKIDLLPVGNKLSHFGFKDLSSSGDFFSNRQSIY